MTDRYTVIHPDTLEAMRRAGHVAKLEDRIETLEAALREIIDIHPFKDPEGDVSVKSLVDLVFHINLNARKALEGKNE